MPEREELVVVGSHKPRSAAYAASARSAIEKIPAAAIVNHRSLGILRLRPLVVRRFRSLRILLLEHSASARPDDIDSDSQYHAAATKSTGDATSKALPQVAEGSGELCLH